MTFSVKHKFVSPKADGSDNTLVRPSNWNDVHDLQCATGVVLGRQTAGVGAVEELTCTAVAASLLQQATTAAMLAYLGVSPVTTGDAKLTLKTAADTGWVMMDDGTIGNVGSGASNRANADTQALFTLLYGFADADVPLQTAAGAGTTRAVQGSATAAFTNGCRIALPKQLGRTFVIAGTGAGLSARTLGSSGGEENHVLTIPEMPTHAHGVNDPGHAHGYNIPFYNAGQWNAGGGSQNASYGTTSSNTASAFTGISIQNQGGGGGHNNMQPFSVWNVMLKL